MGLEVFLIKLQLIVDIPKLVCASAYHTATSSQIFCFLLHEKSKKSRLETFE